MSWVRLDDKMPRHPKIKRLSHRAFRVYVSMICWCSEYETDGRFTAHEAQDAGHSRPQRALDELIIAGLLDETPDGYCLHDYLEYQPSKRDKAKSRSEATERKRRSRSDTSVTAVGQERDEHVTLPRARDPVPSRPDPVPIRSEPPLSEQEQELVDHLGRETQSRVMGGADAPELNWCDDLIRRGATRTDIDHAIQAGVPKRSKKYVRGVLLRRVEDREADHDPDEDTARTADARGARGAGAGRAARTSRAESRGAGWVDR